MLSIKEKYRKTLSYEYLKYIIQNRLFEEGFGFNVKCSMDKVMRLFIPIPINKNKTFDLSRQYEISKIYEKIEEVKVNILHELDKIINTDIDLD